MPEQQYNTCPRCIASGCGACDDYPRCQPAEERSPVFISRPFGDGWELLGHTDLGELYLGLETPEERLDAVRRYTQSLLRFPRDGIEMQARIYEQSLKDEEPE